MCDVYEDGAVAEMTSEVSRSVQKSKFLPKDWEYSSRSDAVNDTYMKKVD